MVRRSTKTGGYPPGGLGSSDELTQGGGAGPDYFLVSGKFLAQLKRLRCCMPGRVSV
jgi:hypothetical protein